MNWYVKKAHAEDLPQTPSQRGEMDYMLYGKNKNPYPNGSQEWVAYNKAFNYGRLQTWKRPSKSNNRGSPKWDKPISRSLDVGMEQAETLRQQAREDCREVKTALLADQPFPSNDTTSRGPDEGWPNSVLPDPNLESACPACGAPPQKACGCPRPRGPRRGIVRKPV